MKREEIDSAFRSTSRRPDNGGGERRKLPSAEVLLGRKLPSSLMDSVNEIWRPTITEGCQLLIPKICSAGYSWGFPQINLIWLNSKPVHRLISSQPDMEGEGRGERGEERRQAGQDGEGFSPPPLSCLPTCSKEERLLSKPAAQLSY